jgi:hypothetical protein
MDQSEIFLPHVDSLQRVSSTEQYFNKQVIGKTLSMDTSQPLYPVICHCPWAH